MSLFGEKIKAFCDQFEKKQSPKNLKEHLKLITPPIGVRRRDRNQQTTSPIDKGFELFDCDREQLQNDEANVESESDDKATTMKIKKQQVLLLIMKKSNKQLMKHLKPL